MRSLTISRNCGYCIDSQPIYPQSKPHGQLDEVYSRDLRSVALITKWEIGVK